MNKKHVIEITRNQKRNADLINDGYRTPPISKRPKKIIFDNYPIVRKSLKQNAWNETFRPLTKPNHGKTSHKLNTSDTITTITNSETAPSTHEQRILDTLNHNLKQTNEEINNIKTRMEQQNEAMNLVIQQFTSQCAMIQKIETQWKNDMYTLLTCIKAIAQNTGVRKTEINCMDQLI